MAASNTPDFDRFLDRWKSYFSRLERMNVSTAQMASFQQLFQHSTQLVNLPYPYIPQTPVWEYYMTPDHLYDDLRQRVALAETLFEQDTLRNYRAAKWYPHIEDARNRCGNDGAAYLEQKWTEIVNQFRSTWDHRVLREVTSNDIWNAQWSGRVSQIAALHLPLRTQIRFDDLVHRIRELAQANYPLIFPHEMPTVATIGEYCDALNNEITDVLVGSVDHQWIGWDNDPRTRAKHNRLRSNVAAGFAPYGPDGQSPTEDTKSAAISDRAGRLSFGSNRAALPEQGYWINKDILGKGGWGCASIWLRYDTNGSIVERVVTKESYLQGNWDRPKYWHGPAADRVPMEYTLQKTLSNVPKANNIVNCRAYGLYERYRMYRLYMEYCQHGDLEQSVKEYFGFSQIVDQSVIGENTIYKVRYPDRLLWRIFKDLAAAACLMAQGFLPGNGPVDHDHRAICHRDLKPANIFLATPRDDSDFPEAKVGDLGLAVFADNPETKHTGCGSHGYMAPEVYTGGSPYPIGPMSDIWSIGRIMLCLVNLSTDEETEEWLPSPVNLQTVVPFKIGAIDGRDPLLCQLINDCLRAYPSDRPDPITLYKRLEMMSEKFASAKFDEEKDVVIVAPDRYKPFAR